MAFDEEKKKKIIKSMDYDSKGKLTTVANQAATLDAPILIVGLGGTGVDSVLRVKKMIYERLKCEEDKGEIKDKPGNIEYMVLDTDVVNEKREIQGIGFNEILDECFIFTAPNVQNLLRNTLPNNVETWINKGIKQAQVLNGAGGVRQLGRLMLFMNLQKVIDTLEAKIKRVTSGYMSKVPLYVFLLTGISGGTGSGTFIDIPYIIKGTVANIDADRPVKNLGIIFLPDVNLSQPGLTMTNKGNIRRNGFAALKELDYLMNLSETKDYFEQDYGTLKVSKKDIGSLVPFETCILMSVKDKDGVEINNPYDYALNVAAETVVNFIAYEKADSVDDFTINSYLSNEAGNRSTYVRMLGEERRSVNYLYSIAGASSAKLPLDDIMSYMTYLAFKEIEGLYNRIPRENEVMDLLNHFGIEPQNMEMQLCQGIPAVQNLQKHTYELIKQAPQRIVSELEEIYNQRKVYVDSKMDDMLSSMSNKIADKTNLLNEIFMDINRGPIFAQQMLFTTRDNQCVTKYLKELSRFFVTNRPTAIQINNLKQIYESKINDLLASRPILQGSKNKYRDEVQAAVTDYYEAMFKAYYYEILETICIQYHNMFVDKNNEVYDCISDLLDTLIMLFNKYGDIRTKVNVREEANVKTMSWSLIDTPTFIRELEQRMGRNDELNVDLHSFVIKFYSFLFSNSDIWTGREKADVVEKINLFISKEFRNVLEKSMDYYVEFIAKSQGKSSEKYSNEILKTLTQKANIMFPVRGTYHSNIPQPGYSYLSVPNNAPAIVKGAREYVKGMSIVKESGIQNSIFMINFESAMPLSAYSELSACHEAYVNLSSGEPGLHLYESNKTNWRKLPSPYPESEWLAGHYVDAEAKENANYRSIFDRAKKYGYIKLIENRFICSYGEAVDYKGILAAYSIDPDAELNDFTDANRCVKAIEKKLHDEERLIMQREIYDTKLKTRDDGSQYVDEEYSKNLFIKMIEVRKEITNMVDNHEQCMDILRKMSKYSDMDSIVVNYVKLLFTDTLIKQRGEYVYVDRLGTLQNYCKLSGKQNNYPDYYLFTKFMALNSKQLDELNKAADNNYMSKRAEDEGYAAMQSNLTEYVQRLKEKITELNSVWKEIEYDDGASILRIYRSIYDSAVAELAGF